jgi:hypothetical protein
MRGTRLATHFCVYRILSGGDAMVKRVYSFLLLLSLAVQSATAQSAQPAPDAAKNVQSSPVNIQTPPAAVVPAAAAALGNGDILSLVEANLSAEAVVAKIMASPCNFDTSPSALRRLKDSRVPDEVIMAMVLAPRPGMEDGAPSSLHSMEAAEAPLKLRLPAGTPIEIESPFTLDSQRVRKGDRISFRVINPVIVEGKVVVAQGATATALVTKAERGGHFGRAGRLAWSMQEVTAVDGSRIPLQLSSRLVGDSKGAKVATQTVITGVLLWPIAPIALLHGLKRGENAILAAGMRFEASVFGEATVTVVGPAPSP